jgi:Holliday junction resolvase
LAVTNTGTRFEYAVRDFLKRNGYSVIRSAGSRGPVDLTAVNDREVLFIQCKKTAGATGFAEDKLKIEQLLVPRFARKQLWVKKDGTVRVLELHFGKWELFSHLTLKEFNHGD